MSDTSKKRHCRAVLVPDGLDDVERSAPQRFNSDDLPSFLTTLFSKMREIKAGYVYVDIDGKDFDISALQPRFILKNGDEELVVASETPAIINKDGRFEFKL